LAKCEVSSIGQNFIEYVGVSAVVKLDFIFIFSIQVHYKMDNKNMLNKRRQHKSQREKINSKYLMRSSGSMD